LLYDDYNIDILKPIENQLWELKEDLLQVHYSDEYSNTYILDIGWYPEFIIEGNFRIVFVRNFEWDNPELMRVCKIKDIYNVLVDCIDYVNNLL
jgi:hypothetical protein